MGSSLWVDQAETLEGGAAVASIEREVQASAAEIWAVLADGWSYSSWVVGTSKIRAVDATWPQVGTRIHHSVGAWPLLIEDYTEVLESVEPTRLVVRARGWPMGEAKVAITIEPRGVRSLLRLDEEPTAGPAAWLNNPVFDAALRQRLSEMSTRLGALAEGRARSSEQSTG
jgi:Polyketide cyclase / dehydrase and lipid transport